MCFFSAVFRFSHLVGRGQVQTIRNDPNFTSALNFLFHFHVKYSRRWTFDLRAAVHPWCNEMNWILCTGVRCRTPNIYFCQCSVELCIFSCGQLKRHSKLKTNSPHWRRCAHSGLKNSSEVITHFSMCRCRTHLSHAHSNRRANLFHSISSIYAVIAHFFCLHCVFLFIFLSLNSLSCRTVTSSQQRQHNNWQPVNV